MTELKYRIITSKRLVDRGGLMETYQHKGQSNKFDKDKMSKNADYELQWTDITDWLDSKSDARNAIVQYAYHLDNKNFEVTDFDPFKSEEWKKILKW